MERCERCKKIIWPWNRSFDFHFADIHKHLCYDCMVPVLDIALDIMLKQRNFFLKALTDRIACVGMMKEPLRNCEKIIESDEDEKISDVCAKCWCKAANEMESE